MFLKSNDQGFAYLEKLVASATEIKIFIDSLRKELTLDSDADIDEIKSAIMRLSAEYKRLLGELDNIKDNLHYSKTERNEAMAELVEKEIATNIANHVLFEIMSALTTLLNGKNDFEQESDYFEFLNSALVKIVNMDVRKRKDLISAQTKEINSLRTSLEKKLESFALLQIKIANLFPFGCKDLSTFDKDFERFEDEYQTIKDKAAKYDFLIETGSIREVSNTISGHSFYVNYNK